MTQRGRAHWLGALLFTAGCVGTPTASGLAEGATLDSTSELGLVTGRLSAVGELSTGSNDFELMLASENEAPLAELESFEAVMPAHAHRATPSAITVSGSAYRIVKLPLSMPGVWRLTGSLWVEGQADTISFDIDVP